MDEDLKATSMKASFAQREVAERGWRRQHRSTSQSMQRTWGPFTGRQLTSIIITVVAVAALPGTAWAVDAFTNVAIQDPTTGTKAAVTAGGHLAVDTRLPGQQVSHTFVFTRKDGGKITGPAGNALSISAINISNTGTSTEVAQVEIAAVCQRPDPLGNTNTVYNRALVGKFVAPPDSGSSYTFPDPVRYTLSTAAAACPSGTFFHQIALTVTSLTDPAGEADVIVIARIGP